MAKLTHDEAFDRAHAHVAKWEGGLSDHPNDPGGITNYGVSLQFLKGLEKWEADINKDGTVDRKDVLAITKDKAKAIFKRHFWTLAKAERLPPLIAMAYYDYAVNAGAGRAAIVLQETINKFIPGAIAKTATNVGPLTQKYCQKIVEMGKEKEFVNAYIDARDAWYRRLASSKPSSSVFLKGWLNRTKGLRQVINETAAEFGIC